MSNPTSVASKTVLVTGATGFVGSRLARRLVHDGATVRCAARRPEALEIEGAEAIRLDLLDPSGFDAAVEGIDVVIHVAAWVGFGDASRATAINVDGPRELFEAASRAGVSRFVQLSTCGVLGTSPRLPIDGSTPPDPSQADAYHRSKAVMERRMWAAAEASETELVMLRPGAVYGPGSRGWTAGMLKLVKKGTPVIFGRGDGHAFPVYIDNLVDAIVLAATVDGVDGRTFHLVDETVTWTRWFAYFGAMCGRRPRALPLGVGKALALLAEKTPLELPLDRERLAMMQVPYRFDSTAEREVLGWTPAVSLDEGMKRSEAWLRETGRLR